MWKNVAAAGLEFAGPTPSDGACMFHAVLDQMALAGSPLNMEAHDLRTSIVEYMRQNTILQVNCFFYVKTPFII